MLPGSPDKRPQAIDASGALIVREFKRLLIYTLLLVVAACTSLAFPAFLGDLDGDGKATVYDLVLLLGHVNGTAPLPPNLLPFADINQDGAVNDLDVQLLAKAILGQQPLPAMPLTTIRDTSPADGETDVSVTRRTIVNFTAPLSPDTVLTTSNLWASFGGRKLLGRVELTPDRLTAYLFYLENMPGSAEVQITFDGTGISDFRGVTIDADGDGQPGGVRIINFQTLSQSPVPGTIVVGRIFASELAIKQAGNTNISINVPLGGVTITADGLEQTVRAVSDNFGNFRITNAPGGKFFVHVDGRTVSQYDPTKDYYPYVGKEWVSVIGQETNIGEVYLPKIVAGTLQPVSATESTSITFPTNVLADHPELAGVTVTIEANSLFANDGTRGGMAGIAPVPPDRLPSRLPLGLNFPLVITVQTDGAQNLSEPASVCFPNLPDPNTGQVLKPGDKTALWSFNHDTGQWEVEGPMTISADGKLACSDPGTGIRHPGWHGVQPGTQGGGGPPSPDGPWDPKTTAPSQALPGTGPDGNGGDSCGNSGGQNAVNEPPGSEDTDDGGDPVYLFSGQFHHQETDLRIKGVGLDFTWTRRYASYITNNWGLGWGWDFSYNIHLAREGASVRVFDGHGRADLYMPNFGWEAGQAWTMLGSQRQLVQETNGMLTLTFPGHGRWIFEPIQTNQIARIFSSVDRYGNTLTFNYDTQGRLSSITDTLHRPVTVTWNADGFISAVTDFAGRSVHYAYYGPFDQAGAVGDLKSATSASVIGVPNGNDFPDGKTVSYTYTAGFNNDGLNHKLVSITDGRRNNSTDPTFGQGPYLINSYSTNQDSQLTYQTSPDPKAPPVVRSLSFGRLVRQIWGGGALKYDYTTVLIGWIQQNSPGLELISSLLPHPSAAVRKLSDSSGSGPKGHAHPLDGSAGAVGAAAAPPPPIPAYGTKCIVNNRLGHVEESVFDGGNRCLDQREFTGTADPGQFTTSTNNRPALKLRSTDPDYFESSYLYDSAYNQTFCYQPKNNYLIKVYDEAYSPITRTTVSSGNLLSSTKVPFRQAGQPVGDQPSITESFVYGPGYGSCCGFNFVTNYTDGRGNSVARLYDTNGNLVQITERLTNVVQNFEYNSRGQMTKHTWPDNGTGSRRVDVYDYYNSGPSMGYLKEAITDFGNLNLTNSYEYDLVGNVTSKIDARGHDTQYIYNQLDQVVREISREVTDGSGIRYQKDYYYDANNNLTRIVTQNLDESGNPYPESTLTTSYEYEILNKVTKKTEEVGPNHTITTQYKYDANRNLTEVDFGEATAGRQTNNIVQFQYDERDLLFKEIRSPGTPDQSTTQYDYDGNKNLIRISEGLENSPRVTTMDYDGYDRLMTKTDPMWNVTSYHYDADNNVVSVAANGELIDVPGSTGNRLLSQVLYNYDPMNRLTDVASGFHTPDTRSTNQPFLLSAQATNHVAYSPNSQIIGFTNANGHALTIAYDTANRRRTLTDARGNIILLAYDGNNNVTTRTETEKSDLADPDEVFTTTFVYDNLDRLIQRVDNVGTTNFNAYDSRDNRTLQVDGRGNKVHYGYDGLNRLTATVRDMTDTGDGSGIVTNTITARQTWDDSSRLVGQTDDNGNTTSYFYDGLNRKFATMYADGTKQTNTFDVHGNAVVFTDANVNVVTTTFDLFNRPIRRDIIIGPGVANTTTFEVFGYDGLSRLVSAQNDGSLVTLSYDALGRVVQETQNGEPVESAFDPLGNRLVCVYPSGRTITNTFDELERLKTVGDQNGWIANYAYVGLNRVKQRDYANGTRMTYQYDGITGVPNPPNDFEVKQVIRTTHSVIPTGVAFDDRSYTWDRAGNKTSHHELQAGGAAKDYAYDSMNRLIQSMTSPASGPATTIQYALDGVGNRISVAGGDNPGNYIMSATLPEPGDMEMNQYTTTPLNSLQYDKNGNLVNENAGAVGWRFMHYDWRNERVYLSDSKQGVSANYRYDALGRRISKFLAGAAPSTNLYLLCGWQIIEERSDLNKVIASHAYGRYLDEPLSSSRASGISFYHCDQLFDTSEMTDSTATLTEAYTYSDFGQLQVYAPNGTQRTRSLVGTTFYFTGREYDQESGCNYLRTRYMDPVIGRFLSRDPIGLWGDPANNGNPSAYAADSPAVYSDPFGLDPSSCNDLNFNSNPQQVPFIPTVVVSGNTIQVPYKLGIGLGFTVDQSDPSHLTTTLTLGGIIGVAVDSSNGEPYYVTPMVPDPSKPGGPLIPGTWGQILNPFYGLPGPSPTPSPSPTPTPPQAPNSPPPSTTFHLS